MAIHHRITKEQISNPVSKMPKPIVTETAPLSPVRSPVDSVQTVTANLNHYSHANVFTLQRTLGNRTVGVLLGGPAPHLPVIQAKLGINKSYSKYERESNRVTGQNRPLPDHLKSGIEALSGLSMDEVKVHYNSTKPARINALAYTQGTDIHLASGQEKHLPHEAWHVVQQARGRVQPTHQLRGVEINDEEDLERDAEQMGRLAVSSAAATSDQAAMRSMPFNSPPLQQNSFARSIVQRVGGEKSGYNPNTIVKASFKTAVGELFDLARQVNKIRKKIATKENETKLGSLLESQKGDQVKGAYAESLIAINLDPDWLSKMLTKPDEIKAILDNAVVKSIIVKNEADRIQEKIKDLNTKVSVKLDSKEILDKTWQAKDGGPQPAAKILTGDALYVIKTPKDESKGVFRDVYKKLGKSDGEHNEYVEDDFGKRTRRFAYMEKGYHQWMSFKEKGFLTGKTQNYIGATTGVASDTIDPTKFENQKITGDEQAIIDKLVTPEDKPENRKLSLAYMHQWKGSGPGQRGLSLASTDKENAVFGNAGEPFKTADGAKFKVDLAKTNPTDNILINHYSTDSQTRSKLEGGGKDVSDRRLGTPKGTKPAPYQYERSAIKNREIFLGNLKPEAVVSIAPHTPGIDIDRDAAIFNAQKKAAIDSSQAAKSAKEREEWKAKLQLDLAQAPGVKSAAQQAQKIAIENKNNALQKRKTCNPKYLTEFWRDDLKKKMTDYNYWNYCVTYWSNEEARQKDLINQADTDIATLPAKILACDPLITYFKSLIKAKPDASNAHATKGWATGELYWEGYEAGLKKVQGKKFTKKEAIQEIFDRAYEDGGKKAKAKKEGKLYTEKYDAYWEGYGNALKTALV